MIVPQSVTDRVNQLPVNQHARQLLQGAGQEPDPSLVHLFQLMQWALASGEVPLRPDLYSSLEANLQVLLGAHPQEALTFLLQQRPHEDLLSEEEILQQPDPVNLAALLFQVLQLRLQSANPV